MIVFAQSTVWWLLLTISIISYCFTIWHRQEAFDFTPSAWPFFCCVEFLKCFLRKQWITHQYSLIFNLTLKDFSEQCHEVMVLQTLPSKHSISTSASDWTFNNLHSMPIGSADDRNALMSEYLSPFLISWKDIWGFDKLPRFVDVLKTS